ncbi:MAG TPA: serine hydrolase domain-containing protein, partial [Acidimicrobiales bacterium]
MAIPALTSIAGFGATTVGAAVLDPTGVIEIAGETDQRLPLASVTKMLVAYAALVAIEEGTIALDDPAGPEGSTVAHLLAHASGLGPDDATRTLAKPGTHRIYSSAAYAVLASHIEQASGFE